MKTLKDLFLNELADIYDAERRTVKALPKMASAATCEKLKKAILFHLKETEGHVTKLEQVFQSPTSCWKSLARKKQPMMRSPRWRVPAATKRLWVNPTKSDWRIRQMAD
jgi:ferritin-like metal-binding protein YciE